MKRSNALALVAVVFVAGLAGGALGTLLLHSHAIAPQMREHLGPPPLDRYFPHRDLDLSAEQRRRLEEVFERHRARFEHLHRELRPRVEKLMEEIDREVESILTPEQLERYRRRPERWRPGHRRHGPGRRRPPPTEEPDTTGHEATPVD